MQLKQLKDKTRFFFHISEENYEKLWVHKVVYSATHHLQFDSNVTITVTILFLKVSPVFLSHQKRHNGAWNQCFHLAAHILNFIGDA